MLSIPRDYQHSETDDLETATSNAPVAETDSASSDDDAGLDDATLDETNPAGYTDIDEGLPDSPAQEVNMTDLASGPHADGLSSPEDADLSSPGEVDIEELGDDALSGTDIPADALLDPLQD